MTPVGNAILGLLFLAVGAASTFLMYHLWSYPFDHKSHKSEAPRSLMFVHRALGWVYLGIYIYFMTQMVPRLWNYQIEFPARTVAHLTLGMAIGALLVVKVAIVRFFKHLESSMIPFLGTALLVCTVLLIGLSAPFAFREAYLSRAAPAGDLFGTENLTRVEELLGQAGLEDAAQRQSLATPEALQAGQDVLAEDCVRCHDLRTVLARPRTPENWRNTVQRMADRSTLFAPITEQEQWRVTAYLIAISPELQKSAREKREQEQASQQAQQAASQMAGAETDQAASASYNAEQARQLFETKCSLCHGLDVVEAAPPQTREEAKALVARMVSNGMPASEAELQTIVRHVSERFGQ